MFEISFSCIILSFLSLILKYIKFIALVRMDSGNKFDIISGISLPNISNVGVPITRIPMPIEV